MSWLLDAVREGFSRALGPSNDKPRPARRRQALRRKAHEHRKEVVHHAERTAQVDGVKAKAAQVIAPVIQPVTESDVGTDAGEDFGVLQALAACPATPALLPPRFVVADRHGAEYSRHDCIEDALAANTVARNAGYRTRVVRLEDGEPMTEWSSAPTRSPGESPW